MINGYGFEGSGVHTYPTNSQIDVYQNQQNGSVLMGNQNKSQLTYGRQNSD